MRGDWEANRLVEAPMVRVYLRAFSAQKGVEIIERGLGVRASGLKYPKCQLP